MEEKKYTIYNHDLAITRSSIAMHHGIIKVSSKEGEGTTFTVKIPLSYIPS